MKPRSRSVPVSNMESAEDLDADRASLLLMRLQLGVYESPQAIEIIALEFAAVRKDARDRFAKMLRKRLTDAELARLLSEGR